ncbi:hypothetical protein HY772_04800 [Candidatus Woesearchaeota archaeon]|nr:hypothetical protein [Candidatus Woesearchaeota archaeon]
MDHVAILRKSWGLLPKIVSGEKTIESRWYSSKVVPYGRIVKGETVYFKDSGSPVTVKSRVEKVMQFDDLSSQKITDLLEKYGSAIGISDTASFARRVKDKRYCILVFLRNVETVKPFDIDKKGFGLMSAWLCVPEIDMIKRG